MIEIKSLANLIENKLNSYTSDLHFKIHTDTGRYDKALRKVNSTTEYINGLFSLVGSDVSPNPSGYKIAALTATVEIVVSVPSTDENRSVDYVSIAPTDELDNTVESSVSYIARVRGALDRLCASPTDFPPVEQDDVSYSVSLQCTLTNTGDRTSRIIVGDSMTFSFTAYFYVAENGESSFADRYYLDGYLVPYLTAVAMRTSVIEKDVYSQISNSYSQNAVSTSTASGITFKFSLASLVSAFNNGIKKYLSDGESNVAHILRCVYGKKDGSTVTEYEKSYLVMYQDAERTASGVSVAGEKITLVESVSDYELISFPDTYYVKKLSEVTGYPQDATVLTPVYFSEPVSYAGFDIVLNLYFIRTTNEKVVVNGTTYYKGALPFIGAKSDSYLVVEKGLAPQFGVENG